MSCQRTIHIDHDRICRLCWRQASLHRGLRGTIDYTAGNRHGQQLFLADMFQDRARPRRRTSPSPHTARLIARPRPAAHVQLVAFDSPRDLTAGRRRGFPAPADAAAAEYLDRFVVDYAHRHGWRASTTERVRPGIPILLGTQDTPGARIKASAVLATSSIGLSAKSLLDVLAAADFLDDDQTPALHRWFDRQIADLPAAMVNELRVWFDIMLNGSRTSPRMQPRLPKTAQRRLTLALPALRTWAVHHDSLREIGPADIRAAMPEGGTAKATFGEGLRSIFRVLKARKLIFVNPMARIRTGRPETTIPMPANLDRIREALHDPDPVRALIAALVTFHAVTVKQVATLLLTDVRDGRLHLDGRAILLADPARSRLQTYLDYRHHLWPATANPHLILHNRVAGRTTHVQPDWITVKLGMSAQALREDRILNEAHATNGDARRLCDLFGLSVDGATRYTATIEHPALRELPGQLNATRPARP